MQILSLISGLATFALFIFVLIKLFQIEGVGKGILGLICALYTFVWGWQKHKELDIKNIMIAWSALIVLSMIISALAQQM